MFFFNYFFPAKILRLGRLPDGEAKSSRPFRFSPGGCQDPRLQTSSLQPGVWHGGHHPHPRKRPPAQDVHHPTQVHAPSHHPGHAYRCVPALCTYFRLWEPLVKLTLVSLRNNVHMSFLKLVRNYFRKYLKEPFVKFVAYSINHNVEKPFLMWVLDIMRHEIEKPILRFILRPF